MSIKMAEKQIRKSRKMTLKDFPDREEHIAYLEEFIEAAKSGKHKSHHWQQDHLHYSFKGSPDGHGITTDPPETLAQAREDDARRARERSRQRI